MNTKAFAPLAACVAGLAVLLGGLTAALELPMAAEIVMITGALLLLACAGALLGVAIHAEKNPAV